MSKKINYLNGIGIILLAIILWKIDFKQVFKYLKDANYWYLLLAYPFILMNLILSCIAALQAPIIMMSQNRQEEKDRQRGENDYLINLKAELEIRALHQKIDLLLEEQIKILFKSQSEQIEILRSIEKKISK